MKSLIGIAGILLFLAWGCKNDYFADGGILDESVGELGVSTMDYLERCGADYDTLVALIKICGLEGDVNATGNTFLAPRDYSIHHYFSLIFTDPDKRPASLSEINDEEMEKISGMLKDYIIPGQRILREDLSTAYSYTTTLGGKRARFNLLQEDYLGNLNKGAKYIVFSLDKSEGGGDAQYQSALVVASNLRSVNGVVHVLDSYMHVFGFN